MTRTLLIALCLAACSVSQAAQAGKPAAGDSLDRQTPRSSVTGFLEACRDRNYTKAAQYLDLGRFPASQRQQEGPDLARKLETILNSDPDFNVWRLSRDPEGNLSDDADPSRDVAATVEQNGNPVSLYLERVTLPGGRPQVWLFAEDTVAEIPYIRTSVVVPAIERHLPGFLVTPTLLETPLWKWLALILLALLLISLSRLLDWLLAWLMKIPQRHFQRVWSVAWLDAVVQPLRVMLWLAILRIGIGVVNPSAIARLYIGRLMQMVFVWSVAWCLIRLVGLLFGHIEFRLNAHQQLASRTMLRLGRRTATVTIVILAILLVLENWGYNTATLIAGLGVGGIAIALAAQQTIANVFGGISLIGDQPIRIGEFGKFGDMTGVVEDIGMRSTRVRTLSRTLVSVPNSNFAGFNLENYSVRDKILFNPSFQVKRTATDDQMHALIDGLDKLLAGRKEVESAPTPARIVGIAAGFFTVEVFAYVLTPDIDAFYKIQSELLLQINGLFTAAHVELA
ncbi:MAG TPA: mechanosensitive ion channel family protein [Bryobacteraceae bacterium]|nr:mechanosensitive ion channel family protein [Bryobacteraceae bacterium]